VADVVQTIFAIVVPSWDAGATARSLTAAGRPGNTGLL